MTPEKSLWLAVIEQAIADHQTIIGRIKEMRETPLTHIWPEQMRKEAISRLRRELSKLMREMRSSWFVSICDWVGIHHDHIMGIVKRAEADAGVAA